MMHPAPWIIMVDGVGAHVFDAERQTVMEISHHDEDKIALWHRIVDAVNAKEAKAKEPRTLPIASTEAVGARSQGEIGDALLAPWRIVESPVAISIVDADGDEVFCADLGDQSTWVPIVRAVNAHDGLVAALTRIDIVLTKSR